MMAHAQGWIVPISSLGSEGDLDPMPRDGSRDRAEGQRRYPEEVWEHHKARIWDLYMTQNRPLREVRQLMVAEHGFEARYVFEVLNHVKNATATQYSLTDRNNSSEKMYKLRIARWGFAKHITKHRANCALNYRRRREFVGKLSEFELPNRQMDLENYLKRKNTTEMDFMELMLDDLVLPKGVQCRSPTLSISKPVPLPDEMNDQHRFLRHFISFLTSWVPPTAERLTPRHERLRRYSTFVTNLLALETSYAECSAKAVTSGTQDVHDAIDEAFSTEKPGIIFLLLRVSCKWQMPGLAGQLWRYAYLSAKGATCKHDLALSELLEFLINTPVKRGQLYTMSLTQTVSQVLPGVVDGLLLSHCGRLREFVRVQEMLLNRLER
jgi:hypothetical protein